MTFPFTALAPKVELELAGVWTDISSYVYVRGGIEITRGRQDESSSPEPSKCRLTLNNRDGRFCPRNPVGAYFGSIGRNTPMRVSVLLGQVRLLNRADGSATSSVSTNDSAAVSVTGDIDIRVDARMTAWTPNDLLLSKYSGAGARSYRIYPDSVGRLALQWSSDGTTELLATSTVPLPATTGRQAVRATLDVNNGAAGRTITFYTAPTAAGTWTQLGDPVVQAGVTSIFDSTTALSVGRITGAEYYSAEVRNGIAGSLVANPVFTSQTEGATSFSDGLGNTWTLLGDAALTNRRYRFVGEVSSWPVAWDLSGKDVYTTIEGAGIRRRLTQGASPLRSAFYRAASTILPSLVAYWPCEDLAGSTSIAPGLSGGSSMSATSQISFAADSDSFPTSAPLMVMDGGTATGGFPAFATGFCQVRFLGLVPATPSVDALLASVRFGGGTIGRADLAVNTSGSLNLALYDRDGVFIDGTGYVGFAVLGRPLRYSMELTQSGGNIDLRIQTIGTNDSVGAFFDYTVLGRTMGLTGSVALGPQGTGALGLLGPVTMGQLTVQSATTDIFDEMTTVLDAYAEETAGVRIERLLAEESVPLVSLGVPSDSVKMGAQRIATFVELIDQCVASDLGIASELRDVFGLAFRPRTTIYSQNPRLTLPYGNLQYLEPIDDDQNVRNDITVQRINGSSARSVLESGPLSVLAPPDGVGRYDEQIDVSLFADTQTPDQASWRLMQGTVDEARYPTILLNLATGGFASSSSLTANALDLDQGDLLVIEDPPAWLPPDDIRQIAQGFTERIEPFGYTIEVNCTPASVWQVGVYDQGLPATRYAADGATLSAGITSTATGAGALSIVTPAGKPLWTSTAGNFPLDIVIGGEKITLSAIAATASPQSATVSARSVNGVVKAHLAGAALDVADSAVYAL